MKVLHVLDALNFSGAEMMYVAAAKDFQQLGCQLYVISSASILGDYASFFVDAGYVVKHFPYSKNIFGRFSFYHEIQEFIKKESIDVVHVHRNGIKCGIAYCAWRCGIKCVCTHHSVYNSHWYSILYHRLMRWCMTHAFGCIQQSISHSVYNNEKDYYHNITILVNNWYDITKFFPASKGEREEIRNQLGLNNKTKVIISVGSCRELKRHKDIIDTVAIIKSKYPNMCYLHLGDGDMLKEEKSYAKQKCVDSNIRFVGNQTDVRKYLIASDVYVMTSRLEGLSLSTIEAMACGVPVVLYHVPGLKDFNLEKECSFQIEESPSALASMCIKIFEGAKNVDVVVANAIELVKYKFNMHKNVREIFKLYF